MLPTSVAENQKNIEKPLVLKVFRENWTVEVSIDFSMILMPSWLHFGGQHPSKIHPKSNKNRSKSEVQDGMPLGLDFLRILPRFGTQLGSQNSPRAHQNRIKIELQLQPGFGSVLGASWSEKSFIFYDFGVQNGGPNVALSASLGALKPIFFNSPF